MDIAQGQKVMLRLDLDVDSSDNLRLKSSKETIDYLLSKNSKIIIVGHKGRPSHEATDGKPSINGDLSLKPVSEYLSKIINKDIKFIYDIVGIEAQEECSKLGNGEIIMLENLRFDEREEEDDENFAKSLASLAEIYVNEAFGVSHRNHASILGVKKFINYQFGFRFQKEIENLSKVFDLPAQAGRPLVFLLSGAKKDKLDYLEGVKKIADKVLVGGRLPEYMGDISLESVRLQPDDAQVVIGNLTMDKEDLTLNTVSRFEKEIAKAKTIIVSGPMGKFEEEGHRQGTIGVFNAIKNSTAFKIAGGGDTEVVINTLNMAESFDWVSVGGGAMLEFLTKQSLPCLE